MSNLPQGGQSLGENLQVKGPRCFMCRQMPAEHTGIEMRCPITSHYSACRHVRQIGSAMVSSNGTGYSDSTCQDCGERFVTGVRP